MMCYQQCVGVINFGANPWECYVLAYMNGMVDNASNQDETKATIEVTDKDKDFYQEYEIAGSSWI